MAEYEDPARGLPVGFIRWLGNMMLKLLRPLAVQGTGAQAPGPGSRLPGGPPTARLNTGVTVLGL
jgi:hypothetical protein